MPRRPRRSRRSRRHQPPMEKDFLTAEDSLRKARGEFEIALTLHDPNATLETRRVMLDAGAVLCSQQRRPDAKEWSLKAKELMRKAKALGYGNGNEMRDNDIHPKAEAFSTPDEESQQIYPHQELRQEYESLRDSANPKDAKAAHTAGHRLHKALERERKHVSQIRRWEITAEFQALNAERMPLLQRAARFSQLTTQDGFDNQEIYALQMNAEKDAQALESGGFETKEERDVYFKKEKDETSEV